MNYDPLECNVTPSEVGVYECEVHLKFRLIEEKSVLSNPEQLLEFLLDAYACGADEYLEPVAAEVKAKEISEVTASPQMRRRLIRLRNSKD
ncbi:Npun_R1517 family heterocyst differentiation transcriptional regulator [Cyanobacteria bacterium FACHB-DQ100]|uniref:Npun_R1517 family heterocyst differentiation transcriptional regulator n=1 Tax=Leptolyngbya sp. DQ-M1 TaxID=2933920 RepID=UPI001994FDB9|nr:Npun_R1517 family heterocyst differentiation transcriptional regulator [Cyanobacteria bacterium FACHB-DQ100]